MKKKNSSHILSGDYPILKLLSDLKSVFVHYSSEEKISQKQRIWTNSLLLKTRRLDEQ